MVNSGRIQEIHVEFESSNLFCNVFDETRKFVDGRMSVKFAPIFFFIVFKFTTIL